MKVKELINILKEANPENKISFSILKKGEICGEVEILKLINIDFCRAEDSFIFFDLDYEEKKQLIGERINPVEVLEVKND